MAPRLATAARVRPGGRTRPASRRPSSASKTARPLGPTRPRCNRRCHQDLRRGAISRSWPGRSPRNCQATRRAGPSAHTRRDGVPASVLCPRARARRSPAAVRERVLDGVGEPLRGDRDAEGHAVAGLVEGEDVAPAAVLGGEGLDQPALVQRELDPQRLAGVGGPGDGRARERPRDRAPGAKVVVTRSPSTAIVICSRTTLDSPRRRRPIPRISAFNSWTAASIAAASAVRWASPPTNLKVPAKRCCGGAGGGAGASTGEAGRGGPQGQVRVRGCLWGQARVRGCLWGQARVRGLSLGTGAGAGLSAGTGPEARGAARMAPRHAAAERGADDHRATVAGLSGRAAARRARAAPRSGPPSWLLLARPRRRRRARGYRTCSPGQVAATPRTRSGRARDRVRDQWAFFWSDGAEKRRWMVIPGGEGVALIDAWIAGLGN